MLDQELREQDVREETGPEVETLFEKLQDGKEAEEYNYEHFRTGHFAYDVKATVLKLGVAPGDPAPDFTVWLANGGELRLSELRGRPVLLHFGSPT